LKAVVSLQSSRAGPDTHRDESRDLMTLDRYLDALEGLC